MSPTAPRAPEDSPRSHVFATAELQGQASPDHPRNRVGADSAPPHTCCRWELSSSSEPIPTSCEGGKSIRLQREGRIHLVRRKSSPIHITDSWGRQRGRREKNLSISRDPWPLHSSDRCTTRCRQSHCADTPSREIRAKGPSRGKERAPPENGELRRKKVRDHVGITEATTTFQA